ncbi:MAG: YhcN/YlaJ family sporulation lipoprotein [Clostridiaceae bacterium]
MIKNSKMALSTFAGVCLITTMLSACSQAGTSRAPGQNTGRPLGITQRQGLNRNNLMNATTLGSMPGTTLGNMAGTTLGNMTGTTLSDMARTTPGGVNLTQTAPDRQKADNIRRQIMNMKGVSDANVIVMGNTALVGYRPSGSAGNTKAVKDNIANKCKQVDRTITNVTVSESADIMARMSRLGTNITGTGTATNFADEFRKLINGVNTTR